MPKTLSNTRNQVAMSLMAQRCEEMTSWQGLFMVRERAAHVVSEAMRVGAFAAVCAGGDAGAGSHDGEDSAEILGRLMNESHESCRIDYDCSCPELDELVTCLR
jgi:galactokinase